VKKCSAAMSDRSLTPDLADLLSCVGKYGPDKGLSIGDAATRRLAQELKRLGLVRRLWGNFYQITDAGMVELRVRGGKDMSTFQHKPSTDYGAAVAALRRLPYEDRAPAYAEAVAEEARSLWIEREGVTASSSSTAGWRRLLGQRVCHC
jgi:hypothetical protein